MPSIKVDIAGKSININEVYVAETEGVFIKQRQAEGRRRKLSEFELLHTKE